MDKWMDGMGYMGGGGGSWMKEIITETEGSKKKGS